MQDFLTKDISAGYFFSLPAFLDDGFILTVPEIPVSRELLTALDAWGFRVMKSDGKLGAGYNSDSKASGSALKNDDKLNEARTFYEDFYSFACEVYAEAEIKGSLQYRIIAAKMPNIIKFVQANKRYVLQIERAPGTSRIQSLASHAVRSTIFSIIIGTQLKEPVHRMIEMSIAAFVHEIGMLKLPQSIINSTGSLNPEERKQINSHPILGFNILKENQFPMTVCAVALEHHERENGQGYPRRLPGASIGQYSKIVSVACSFEAITSDRSYHLARSGFEGIIDILKNKDKGYDDLVIKALVMSISIYPIGSFVLLSNNKKARVIDANSVNPRYPIVQLIDEVGPDGEHIVVETSPVGLHVTRPLNKDEIPSAAE